MIAGDVLAAWLADPARQEATTRAIGTFSERWYANPAVADLRRELEIIPANDAAALVAAAQRFMARSDQFEILIADLLTNSAADPFFRAPFRLVSNDIHSGMLLYDDPLISISIGVIELDALAAKKMDQTPAAITFTGQWSVINFVKAGDATLSFWEAPQIDGDFLEEKSGRCHFVDRRMVKDGETLVVDGRSQSYVIERAEGTIICLQAVIGAQSAPLSVSYDWKTHGFVGASSTDEQACRSLMMASLLRIMDRTDAFPAIQAVLKGQHFYTRWQIMRELLALDAEAALPSLKEMAAGDPHPEIREAARQTLETFFGPEHIADEGAVKCPA